MKQLLEKNGLFIDAAAIVRLEKYLELLIAWNRQMDLTSVPDHEMAERHFVDSLLPLTIENLFPEKCTLIDVGTGAGFPGMVLRILEEDFDLTLLDSLGKRIAWLDETCGEMGLGRVECVHARAEEFAAQRRERYDVATSRAVADLPLLCELALPLVKVGGQFLAMKSVDSDEEIARARGAIGQLGGKVAEVYDYAIPESDVVHRVVVIEKVRPTPPQFPRPWAKIKKAPLK